MSNDNVNKSVNLFLVKPKKSKLIQKRDLRRAKQVDKLGKESEWLQEQGIGLCCIFTELFIGLFLVVVGVVRL